MSQGWLEDYSPAERDSGDMKRGVPLCGLPFNLCVPNPKSDILT